MATVLKPSTARPSFSFVYRLIMLLVRPIVGWWGRLEVRGASLIPDTGPTLLVSNHDTNWDPLIVGVAARRRAQIRAVAKSELWCRQPLAWVLDRMRQLPITRGRADRAELGRIMRTLASGACVGIFPEGRLSGGDTVRAFSGAGWLAKVVPEARVVAVAITGAVDLSRFPARPRILVEFFEPLGGQRRADESAIGFSRRVMTDIRDRAPAVAAGRLVAPADVGAVSTRTTVAPRPRPSSPFQPVSTGSRREPWDGCAA
jgi:1-acyl-sn-glycerol-3-phosphate acyltransferase